MDKNKDKNIEDMTMFIELACTSRELDWEDRREIAKTLYALGYRKIADGEVVIKADIKCIDSTTAVNVIEFFAKHNEKVRQETAIEILQIADRKLDNITRSLLKRPVFDDGYREAVNDIKYTIVCEYGIELK